LSARVTLSKTREDIAAAFVTFDDSNVYCRVDVVDGGSGATPTTTPIPTATPTATATAIPTTMPTPAPAL